MRAATRQVLLVTTALAAGLLPPRGWSQAASQPAPGAPTDLGAVQAAGGAARTATQAPATAAEIAPSHPPLSASQPTSVVGPNYIQNNVLPQQNYDEIIKFTPSVQNVAPVGPGLQQNFAETIRGFNYTQFNTIFDGIPIPGTPSTFAPQTEAYFTGHDIGSVSIDRGPGTASTIGNATFGGTVSLTSKTPLNTITINPYGTYGSFGTRLYGIEGDTGSVAGNARALIDLSKLESNGFLSGTATQRRNGFVKVEVPLNSSTVLTFVGMANNSRTNVPYGASIAQMQQFGYNYALSSNPHSQAFTGYNVNEYTTDFEYVGIRSTLPDGWTLDDKAYTASYYKRGVQGVDPNGSTPNLSGNYYVNGVRTNLTGDVPGYPNKNDFRDWGDLFRATKDTAFGQLRAGFWFDYVAGDTYRVTADLSRGLIPYATSATGSPYSYLYRDTITTVQPYVEFAWKPLPGLTITPGVKYTSFTRALDAAINSSTKKSADFHATYNKAQPAVDAHYVIAPGWVAYAQVAKGFLGPPLNVLFTTNPVNVTPEETWNYQIGTTYQATQFSLGADLYYIDFSNLISSSTVAGTTIYGNGGGAIYKGVEVEGTYQLRRGLALYANGSLNDGDYKGRDVSIQLVPRQTAAIGPIVQRYGLYASLLAKYIGPQYLVDNTGTKDQFPIRSYADADLTLGYTLPAPGNRAFNARLNVFNLFDEHALTGLIGQAANGTALYSVLPGRSVFFTLSASL